MSPIITDRNSGETSADNGRKHLKFRRSSPTIPKVGIRKARESGSIPFSRLPTYIEMSGSAPDVMARHRRESATQESSRMHLQDRVYGGSRDRGSGDPRPDRLRHISALKGVMQAGPSALAFPFKDVTRFEHSLGVFVLLRHAEGPAPRTGGGVAPRHLAHRLLARGRFRLHVARAGSSRASQALDAGAATIWPALSRGWAILRANSTTIRSIRCSSSRFPGSVPIGSTTSCATARPAASCSPNSSQRVLGCSASRRLKDRSRRRRGRARGRRPVRDDEPRVVGRPGRGVHLQRVCRRTARRACGWACSSSTT